MADPIVITLPADMDPEALRRVLDALPDQGVALAEPSADAGAVATALDAALATAPALPEALGAAFMRLDGTGPGLALTLAATAAALAAGWGVERLALRLTGLAGPTGTSRTDTSPTGAGPAGTDAAGAGGYGAGAAGTGAAGADAAGAGAAGAGAAGAGAAGTGAADAGAAGTGAAGVGPSGAGAAAGAPAAPEMAGAAATAAGAPADPTPTRPADAAASGGGAAHATAAMAATADGAGAQTSTVGAATAADAAGAPRPAYAAAGGAAPDGAAAAPAPGAAAQRPGPNGAAGFAALLAASARWTAARLAGLALFALTALALARLLLPPEAQPIADAAVALASVQRLAFVLVLALAAPDAPRRRLAALSDADARGVVRLLAVVLGVAFLLAFTLQLVGIGDPGEGSRLARVALALASAVPGALFFYLIRKPVAGLILRAFGADAAAADAGAAKAGAGAADPLAGFLAARWHLFYILIVMFTAMSRAAAQLGVGGFDLMARSGMASTLTAVLTPFVLAGVGLWRDERLARAEPKGRAVIVGGAALARGLIVAAAASFVLHAWGLDPFAAPGEGASGLAGAVPALVRTLFVVVVGLSIWRAVGEAMQAFVAPPRDTSAILDEDAAVRGASRLETVMPVLRGVALAAIGLTTMMLALGMLGVNITPILAGAGVVGLAIGFGAQRMVQDVISGAFYLYEDAFRVGEYIETGQGKGVVERISIRSVRLRHPRGPVYTVPFSAMGTVQNHSRDWVKVKFTFDVPQDADLEVVRKLVKKAGEGLLTDPDLAGKFLEPMKSQGAVAITGQAFTVGVKFVTRPGQQFLVRRKAMAALQKALAAAGIELMTPRITLDGAGGPQDLAKAMASAGGGR